MHHAHHAMPYRAYVQAQSPEAVQPAPPPVQQVASPEVFMMASTDQKAEFPPFNTVSRAKDYDLSETFDCNLHIIKTHEETFAHKTSMERFYKLQSNKRQLVGAITIGRHRRDKRRNMLLEDPDIVNQFGCVLYLLRLGCPMTELEAMQTLLRTIKQPAVAKAHWKDSDGWQMAEAIDAVYQEANNDLLDAAQFISITLDEATTMNSMSVMCVHAYVLVNFERKQIFLALKEVQQAPNADGLLRTLQSVLEAASLPASALQRKLVALGTDGAGIMLGPHSGLAIKARQQLAPFTSSVHCAAHGVSLAASVMAKHRNFQRLMGVVENIRQHFCKSPARTQKYKLLCHSLGLKGQLVGRAVPTRWLSLRKPAERLVRDIRALVPYFDSASVGISNLLTDLPTLLAACGLLPILRSLDRLSLLCHSRAIAAEDLMQEAAQTANSITAMYTGPSPFSALDFPELAAFADVAGPDSSLVYNSSGHLALQPHGNRSMSARADEADNESEDEEVVGSRQAAADMETPFVGLEEEEEEEEAAGELGGELVELYAIPLGGRWAAPVPASDFQQHVDGAKQELTATAVAVVRDLHSRFLPLEHAKGLAVVYAQYWDKQPSDEDFLERLAIVKARYCMEATLANGQRVPALLDQHKLSAQQSAFVEVMRSLAEYRVELSSAAVNPAEQTTKLWRYLAGQPITKADISEYFKLAELALVMTPGSVEEERMFSAMAYLKECTRNRLQECHLNVCTRVFSSKQFELYGVYPVVEMAYDQRQEGYAALGSFIDGDNQEGVRFAFTQPVVMKYLSSTGQGKVMQMFIGSRKGAQPEGASPLSLAALPAPKDPAVKLSIAGGELLAVYRFEGYITPASAESARRQLLAALQRDGVQLSEEAAAGAFRVGQYGAVYQLGGRINELYLKVEPGRAGAAA
ncbi:hypothetical protein QJQ45_024487 [Haematococcus lacustris]|nr:hypothetical protein QJQ45_024487 [Haematococcus lacustris]